MCGAIRQRIATGLISDRRCFSGNRLQRRPKRPSPMTAEIPTLGQVPHAFWYSRSGASAGDVRMCLTLRFAPVNSQAGREPRVLRGPRRIGTRTAGAARRDAHHAGSRTSPRSRRGRPRPDRFGVSSIRSGPEFRGTPIRQRTQTVWHPSDGELNPYPRARIRGASCDSGSMTMGGGVPRTNRP